MTWWKAPDGRRWDTDKFSSVYAEADTLGGFAVKAGGAGAFGPVVLQRGFGTQAEAQAAADSIVGGWQ